MRNLLASIRSICRSAAGLLVLGTSLAAHADGADPALAKALADPARTPAFAARDTVRHPAGELAFFGLTPTMTVVELWPGGGYWTEILAPYLKAHGHYIAALSPDPPKTDGNDPNSKWRRLVAARGDAFGEVTVTRLGKDQYDIAPAGSADLVLTFRNLHNWMGAGNAEQTLAACFRALKPGGILGIEDHRARADVAQDPKADNGYVREDYAIALAKKAGFRFVGKSEINANPRDTKDYKEGVWTLPPVLTLGDKDRAKYVAIGEADNFVLKFEKPRH